MADHGDGQILDSGGGFREGDADLIGPGLAGAAELPAHQIGKALGRAAAGVEEAGAVEIRAGGAAVVSVAGGCQGEGSGRGEAAAQGEYEESQKMIDNVAKELEDTKATQYKETQKLFELRAKQASLIGEISSTLSASRNLTANINKLRVEEDRQQELLYNADYSIQQ